MRNNLENKNKILALAPSVILILLFSVLPLFYSLYLSFFEKHVYSDVQKFIFLNNYYQIFSDKEFWNAFRNGFIYTFTSLFFQITIGICVSLYLNSNIPLKNIQRAVVFFPYLLPTIVVIILWKWMLNSSNGIFTYFFSSLFNLNHDIVFFKPQSIIWVLVFVSTWQFTPFVIITLLARLQNIPENLYNSAKMDGANYSQQFFYIVLPQLKNVLLGLIILRFIWMFTKFDTIWLLVGSGSLNKYVETLPIYTYHKTFSYLQAGMGSAMVFIMFIILLVFSSSYIKLFMVGEKT